MWRAKAVLNIEWPRKHGGVAVLRVYRIHVMPVRQRYRI